MYLRAIALEEVPYSAPFPLFYTFNVGTSILTTTSQPMEEHTLCLEKIDLLKKKQVWLIFYQKSREAKDAKEKHRKRVERSHGQFNHLCFHKPLESRSSSEVAAAVAAEPTNI